MSVDMFENAFRRLLLLGGIEIGPSEESAVSVDPTEPLQGTPPEIWIRSAALHFSSLYHNCDRLSCSLASLWNVLAGSAEERERVSDLLWEALEEIAVWDTRFHAFFAQIYSELIRDLLLSSDRLPVEADLRPHLTYNCETQAPSAELIAKRLCAYSSLSDSDIADIARALCDLYATSVTICEVLGLLISDTNGNDSVLAARFANAQLVSLRLAEVMLSVDVAAYRLLPSVT